MKEVGNNFKLFIVEINGDYYLSTQFNRIVGEINLDHPWNNNGFVKTVFNVDSERLMKEIQREMSEEGVGIDVKSMYPTAMNKQSLV